MKIVDFVKKEAVLCISALLAFITVFFVPPDAEYIGYINFRVLGLLFSLMAVVSGLRGLYVFDRTAAALAKKCGSMRSLVLVLTSLCFFSSMLITNDVALITFVPLAINVLAITGGENYIIYTVVLQTVAANMGSMLTPMGNPQNLYLVDFYSMSMGEFFSAALPVCALSGIILLLLHIPIEPKRIEPKIENSFGAVNKRLLHMYVLLGMLAFAAVFNIVSDKLYIVLTAVTLVCVMLFDRAALKKVDWFLLLTFVMFFIFVGNAARIEQVRCFIGSLARGREILAGALSSQVISNVPAAVMLSSFTDNGRGLMLGVDIGGLGTPVASLASLISYRLYAAAPKARRGRYMLVFLGINFALLAVLLSVCIFFEGRTG